MIYLCISPLKRISPDPNKEQSMEMKSVFAAADHAVPPAHRLEKVWRLHFVQSVHLTGKSAKLK